MSNEKSGPESTRPETQSEAASPPAEAGEAGASGAAKPDAPAAEPPRASSSIFEAAKAKLRREFRAAGGDGHGAGADAAADSEAQGAVAEAERIAGLIQKLSADNSELKDRNVRLLAEMENLRRRTEREKEDTSKYAIARFARDLLNVGDNLQRALATVPAEATAKDATFKTFFEGVQLTDRELLNVLERHGVKRLEAVGAKFDPNFHQAMMEMESPDVPAGTVIQAFAPAYVIGDRILRPAMVVISKGGAAASSASPPPPAADAKPPANDDQPAAGQTAGATGSETSDKAAGDNA